MTALAEPDYYDDFDSDFRSELDAKYEEGFGYSPHMEDEDDDRLDDLFAGLFDASDEDDDDAEPLRPTAAPKKAAAKASSGSPAPKKATAKGTPAASEVVVTSIAERRAAAGVDLAAPVAAPAAALAVAAPVAEPAPAPVADLPRTTAADEVAAAARRAAERARAAADEAAAAAKQAVAHAVAKAAAAKAAAAEASAAEQAAQAALDASTAAEQDAVRAAEQLELVLAAPPGVTSGAGEVTSAQEEPAQKEELVQAEEAPAAPAGNPPASDPNFAPHIAPVNQHVEFLRKLRPGFEVPYVDPMHSVDECRIVSLFSNTGEASPRGYVWAGDDAAATRLLGLQYQLGLRPEWIMPWNAYPWFTPGEANGKLTPEQLHAGLKPLLTFLKTVPRVSAIVAHGTEANRLAQMLLKTDNPLIWRRGLKVYKARALHGRAFAGSKERQTEWLIEMGRAYADAMARAGLQAGRA
ncbi:chemotaxis protein histidine kinase CheA [Sinomonas atrocyanea]|nr:chemotaxis protein histidine kinase CheA [Sinomonas atrocyanea]MDR6622243.1 chemotaxis protein histidine kinase CheA [Sinomonas atrocyanea]